MMTTKSKLTVLVAATIVVHLAWLPTPLCGQTKQTVYQFTSIVSSARAAALGGVPLAIAEPDIALAAINPALLCRQVEHQLSVDYTNYVAGISLGHVTYTFSDSRIPGTMAAGLQYLNGGINTRYDVYGNEAGKFSSNEFAFHLSYGRQFDSCFALGATVKPVLSFIGGYWSAGLLADVAASYTSVNNRLAASLLLRNMGSQITAYYDDYGNVPFEIQLAVSQLLEHAPFRISVVLQHLQKYDLRAGTRNSAEAGSEVETDNATLPKFVDNALRHCVFGVEMFPQKTLNLRIGFNYKRRQELKLKNSPGLAGISLGAGLRLKRFNIEYAHARYTLGGASNHISLVIKNI